MKALLRLMPSASHKLCGKVAEESVESREPEFLEAYTPPLSRFYDLMEPHSADNVFVICNAQYPQAAGSKVLPYSGRESRQIRVFDVLDEIPCGDDIKGQLLCDSSIIGQAQPPRIRHVAGEMKLGNRRSEEHTAE